MSVSRIYKNDLNDKRNSQGAPELVGKKSAKVARTLNRKITHPCRDCSWKYNIA